MDTNSSGIAIVGVSGRFPGARNVDQFWQNLVAGVESISFFSYEDLATSGVDVAELKKNPGYVAARGIIDAPDLFDAAFFNIGEREAELIDPQQRLFLEASWEALEDAGCDPARAKGYVGVFAGMGGASYYLNNIHSQPGVNSIRKKLAVTLADKDYLATRVAYKLNLRGPALSINTACSTSLVAVCQACQALLCYQCDIALAGGVSIATPQKRAYYPDGGILSSDGHCRPFDAQASGTNFSEGLGIVVLKRLSEALQDGDRIYAVIKGFALNNDGSAKVGFAAPSIDGQAEVIALALGQADVGPETISYVETHGTATPLGDPIEIAGLTKAFRSATGRNNFCAIGSLKGNVGHMDAAAGVASLIKTALALKHRLLPPTINFTEPNPKIDFPNSPFFVNAQLTEWKAGLTPRRAGVSSFGIGGTNAHVVLEEAPLPPKTSSLTREWQLLALSARTASAMDAMTQNFHQHLKANPGANLADVAYTLQTRRHAFDCRRVLVCRDAADAIEVLEQRSSKRLLTHDGKVHEPSVIFMFPGQGAQYVQMGSQIYRTERVFQEEVDLCAAFLAPHLGLDLRQILFPPSEKSGPAEELLVQTRITQPALFVIEYALARLWMSWGIRPRAMIGHSVGELVAACLAGVFTLEDALRFVTERARLIQARPRGAMLAVRLPEEELSSLLTDSLSIASVNAPRLAVASGPSHAVTELETRLKDMGVAARRLHTSHAFHSAMMDDVLDPLAAFLESVQLKKPSIPYISNVTGAWITDRDATDPRYWADHVRKTVRFADGLGEVLKDSNALLLEVGPGQTLCSLANQHPTKTATQVAASSLSESEQELRTLLLALGKLWLAGASVDWFGFHKDEACRHAVLPAYPFERKRYWIDPPKRPMQQVSPADTVEIEANGSSSAFIAAESAIDAAASLTPDKTPARLSRKEQILETVKADFQGLSSEDLTEIGPSATFLEIGLDSLFLGQAILAIEKRFGIRITFRQLMQEMTTLNELAEFLDQHLATDKLSVGIVPAVSAPAF